MAYKAGVACGVLAGLLVAIGLVWIMGKKTNTNGKAKTEYDERQNIIRGNGYKYGFFGAIVWFFIMMIMDLFDAESILPMGIIAFTGIVVAALVNCAYCIWNDAYWGLNNNRARYIWFLGVITVINVIFPLKTIMHHEMIVNGQLDSSFINLECSVFLLVVMAILGAKALKDKNQPDEDDFEDEVA